MKIEYIDALWEGRVRLNLDNDCVDKRGDDCAVSRIDRHENESQYEDGHHYSNHDKH